MSVLQSFMGAYVASFVVGIGVGVGLSALVRLVRSVINASD